MRPDQPRSLTMIAIDHEKGLTMTQLKLLTFIFALVFGAIDVFAAPQVRYRLTPIVDSAGNSVGPTDMNRRGEIVGYFNPGNPRAFYWRDGTFTDITDRVDPEAPYVEPSSINDRSQILGIYLDPDAGVFRGFLLDDGGPRNIQGPSNAEHVFVFAMNRREQILGLSYDAERIGTNFLWDRGEIQIMDSNFNPSRINDRGAVVGTHFLNDVGRAAIWKDGEITVVGPPSSYGSDINERGQLVGFLEQDTGQRAFFWYRGHQSLLPPLRVDQSYSAAQSINKVGRIVGQTGVLFPEGMLQIATVWDNGKVFDLNTLIHPNDPLRAFVTLTSTGRINDRGEILATGTDSRTGASGNYFLQPMHQ